MSETETGSVRSTAPYQAAVRTSRSASQVLGQLDMDTVPGIVIAERGDHYLLLRPRRRFTHGAQMATALGIAIVLALLICTAITPLVLAGLPAALLPGVPFLLHHRPDLAVSAVEDEGSTRVTAHGEASPELAEYLDRYLGELPSANGHHPSPPPDDTGF